MSGAVAAAATAATVPDEADRAAARARGSMYLDYGKTAPPATATDILLRVREFESGLLLRSLKQAQQLVAADAKSSYNRDVAKTSGGGDRHVILMQQLDELGINPEAVSFTALFGLIASRCSGREWSDEMLALKQQWEEYQTALYQTNYKWMSKNGDVGASSVFNDAVSRLRFSTLTTNELYKYGQCAERVQHLDVLIPESKRVRSAATEHARLALARKRKAVSEETQGVLSRAQQAAALVDPASIAAVVDQRLRQFNREVGANAMQTFNGECVSAALRLCNGHQELATATVRTGHSDKGGSSLSMVDAVALLRLRIDTNAATWKKILSHLLPADAAAGGGGGGGAAPSHVLWRDVLEYTTAIRREVARVRLQERGFAVGAGSPYQQAVFAFECVGITQRASKAVAWCAYSCHGELAAVEAWAKPFTETAAHLARVHSRKHEATDVKERPLKRARIESKEPLVAAAAVAADTVDPFKAAVQRLKQLVADHSSKADACSVLLDKDNTHKMREAVYQSAVDLDYVSYLEQTTDLIDGIAKECKADAESKEPVSADALQRLRILFETTQQRQERGLGAAPLHPSVAACVKSDAEAHDQARRTTEPIGNVCLSDIADIEQHLMRLRSYYSDAALDDSVRSALNVPSVTAVYPDWLCSTTLSLSREFVGLQQVSVLVLGQWTAFVAARRGAAASTGPSALITECIRQCRPMEARVAAVAHASTDSGMASLNTIESVVELFDTMFRLALTVRLFAP